MNTYIVHLYREMRLSYTGIEADTPQAAADIAQGKPTGDADNIEDCDGQNLAALVDLAGDEDYSQSVTVDFAPERHRKAAPGLLDALQVSEGFVHWALDHGADKAATTAALQIIRAAIAEATAACIAPDVSNGPPSGITRSPITTTPDEPSYQPFKERNQTMHNQTVSIGYEREDGDFHIIATLNNNEQIVDEAAWVSAIATIVGTLKKVTDMTLSVLEREDAPDFVNLDE